MSARFKVTVAYAASETEQCVIELRVEKGATVAEAIKASGICDRYPLINPASMVTGIFGQKTRPDTVLEAGDRVEIYRALAVSPKERRRRMARKRQRHHRSSGR